MSPKGVLAVRSLTRAKDSAGRAEAIANVGAERVRLAGDEIMSALHDPLPSVRRQASQALAQISDPRAAVELIHQLEEHPDLLEEETVRALGSLANPMAIPALITTLQSPSSLIRRASARALAQIGEKAEGPARMQVEQALARCATDATDPDLRRAGLQGIRLIGGPWAAEVVTSGILDPLPSVRVAAAEACSELHLTDCVDALRLALARYQDEASAEVAYALGTVGVAADIPAILQEAQQSVSMITRRRALLGVARLLSVQPEVYRLMLLNGMERDGAVMELTRSQSRQNDGVREAVETYANGNEPGALEILAKSMGTDDFRYLAETPVEEGFLVAATRLALVRRSQRRK
jgi:HEAT repeat protein